ncbi:MAG: outer membrane beta-barrel protein [Gammaproteobacteria bacterium]
MNLNSLNKLNRTKSSYKVLSVAFLAAIGFVSPMAQAWEEFDSQVGFDYKHGFLNPHSNWSPILRGASPGFVLWAETKLVDWLGFEMGYDWSTRRGKSHDVPNNGNFLGRTNASGTPIRLTGQVRFRSLYGSLNAHVSANQCLQIDYPTELLFSLGLAMQKPHFTTHVYPSYVPMESHINLNGRTRGIWRVGIGSQIYFTENWGMRAMLRYEGNSSIRSHTTGAAAGAPYQTIFKDNMSLALGLIWKL